MERYYSLNRYLQDTFGCKVYKLALDGGMTCPNRDATLGTGGCIFCSEGGSGEFATACKSPEHVKEQIEAAKLRVSGKIRNGKYIAYFQSYTNTYAPVSYLETLFQNAIAHPDVAALSIATRPDCLPPETLDLLADLNRIKPVWVELGLQTIHEDSIHFIRRGFSNDCYLEAIQNLRGKVSHIVTHVILGLPGESTRDMLQTVQYVADAGTDGIKLQLLHVLKGTDLAQLYLQHPFPVMTLSEYCELLCQCISLLPASIVIHRLTGDGAKRLLIAPLWSADKKRVLNTIRKTLEECDIWQGRNPCRRMSSQKHAFVVREIDHKEWGRNGKKSFDTYNRKEVAAIYRSNHIFQEQVRSYLLSIGVTQERMGEIVEIMLEE